VYLILNLVDNFVINAIVLEQMSIQQCLLWQLQIVIKLTF